MKALIAATIVCLVLGTGIGYLFGWSDAREGLLTVIKSNIEARDEIGRVFLVYSCNGKTVARYDIDNDRLVTPTAQETQAIFAGQETFFQKTYTYATVFLVGGGAFRLAKYARPAMKHINLSDAQKWRYFVAGIVAAGSGVYLGYRVGVRSLPACDDQRILAFLKTPLFWKPITVLVAKDEWTVATTFFAAEGEPKEKLPVLNVALEQIEKGTINSQFFRTLRDVFQTDPTHPPGDQLESPNWLSSDMVLSVYFPVLIFVVLGFVIAARFFAENVKIRRKPRRTKGSA